MTSEIETQGNECMICSKVDELNEQSLSNNKEIVKDLTEGEPKDE
jgi:hypothetical protein